MSEQNNLPDKDVVHKEAKDLMSLLQQQGDEDIQQFMGTLKMLVGQDALGETMKWLVGESTQPPTAVRLMSSNISEKLNLMNILLMFQNLQRTSKLINFLQETEDVMFNHKMLVELETKELLQVYGSAQKSLANILDFSRKYVQDNKAVMAQSEEMGQIIDMLMSLSPERYERLKNFLTDPNITQ